jgi:hypothetical protein
MLLVVLGVSDLPRWMRSGNVVFLGAGRGRMLERGKRRPEILAGEIERTIMTIAIYVGYGAMALCSIGMIIASFDIEREATTPAP